MPPTKQDQKKYLTKLKHYRQKFGASFDPSKLPKYLHSLEDFIKGELLLNEPNNGDVDYRDERTYEPRSRNRSRSPIARERKRRSHSRSSSVSPRRRERSYSPSHKQSSSHSQKKESKSGRSRRDSVRSDSPSPRHYESHATSPPMYKHGDMKSAPSIVDERRQTSPAMYSAPSVAHSPMAGLVFDSSTAPQQYPHQHHPALFPPVHPVQPLYAQQQFAHQVPLMSQQFMPQVPLHVQQPSFLQNPYPQMSQQQMQPTLPQQQQQQQLLPNNGRPVPNVPINTNNEAATATSKPDFTESSHREIFKLRESKIYYTPCIKSLAANIKRAIKLLNLNPSLRSEFSHSTETELAVRWRSITSSALLACAQSLIAAFKTTQPSTSIVSPLWEALEKIELPIPAGLRKVASLYGNVKCPISGQYLCSIDIAADVRAIARASVQMIPSDKRLLLYMSEVDVEKIFARSWLPMSNNDRRFFWIFACQIARLFEAKTELRILPLKLVDQFSSRQQPPWWNLFQQACFPTISLNRLNFLFHRNGWTENDFYQNLGLDEVGRSILTALELEWPDPSLEHLAFGVNIEHETLRTVSFNSRFVVVFSKNGEALENNSILYPTHQGSWSQIATRDLSNDSITLSGSRDLLQSKEQLPFRFHPAAIFYPPHSE